MAADAYAGQKGNASSAVMHNPDNVAPADRPNYDPKDAQWADEPGAAARAGGWPRADGK